MIYWLFAEVDLAEMALATLQGQSVPDIYPPWSMILSHSPTLDSASPNGPRYPLYVFKGSSPANIMEGSSAQMVFRWFRSVGPLVSARSDVTMGKLQVATTIEYWNSIHGEIARFKTNNIHEDLQQLPRFGLRFYSPCSLRCSVRYN